MSEYPDDSKVIVTHEIYTAEWDSKDLRPLSTTYTCNYCGHQTHLADMLGLHLIQHLAKKLEKVGK